MATENQIRDALTWLHNDQPAPDDKNVWEWLWEAIQGDFNDNRSTGQIAFDAGVSMIPVVDQICDVRDLIANCRKINQDPSNTWSWVAIVLTLIGLFPSLGSLVKGVLKIFFAFIRRAGLNQLVKVVDDAMQWVITYLRKREVQKYLRVHKIDDVFQYLANKIKTAKSQVSTSALLARFDDAIQVMRNLLDKVTWIPGAGAKAKAAVDTVLKVRRLADTYLAKALEPVQKILDRIIYRLEYEALLKRSAIVDARNIHYRGALPEARAVSLMRTTHPPPRWLSNGAPTVSEASPRLYRPIVDKRVAQGWPSLSDQNIKSFHRLVADEIKGPAKLFRILAPNSRAMSDCWVSEDVFKALMSAPNPREAWRKHLAVWPDWNVNGQFVVYDVKEGQTLKVWRGEASSQTKDVLPGKHLQGGWEQVVFNVPRGHQYNDTMRYYRVGGGSGNRLQGVKTQAEFDALPKEAKAQYIALRDRINHPNISGPFETGWGYTDFAEHAADGRIGLPSLAGQVSSN